MAEDLEAETDQFLADMYRAIQRLLQFLARRPFPPNEMRIEDVMADFERAIDSWRAVKELDLIPVEHAAVSKQLREDLRPEVLDDIADTAYPLDGLEREIVRNSLRLVGHQYHGDRQSSNRWADEAYQKLEEALNKRGLKKQLG